MYNQLGSLHICGVFLIEFHETNGRDAVSYGNFAAWFEAWVEECSKVLNQLPSRMVANIEQSLRTFVRISFLDLMCK